jgi:hypothetical protein
LLHCMSPLLAHTGHRLCTARGVVPQNRLGWDLGNPPRKIFVDF